MDILQQLIVDPLSYAFMQRALLAILMIGVVSGVMGAYVVTRGMAFLGDAMAHSILPGVAIAFLAGGTQAILIGGLVAGIIASLGIGFLTRGGRLSEDTAIGVIFAGMLALGIGIISSANNYALDLTHILIGNILAVDGQDLTLILIVGLIVLIAIALFYKELLIISFDSTLAQTLRLPAEALRITLLVMLALTIVIGVQAVGVALVAAMLVTPAAAARFFTNRLQIMMLLSALIGSLSGAIGLLAAWQLEIAPSASIVLTMTIIFLLAFFFAPGKGYVWSLLGRSAKTA